MNNLKIIVIILFLSTGLFSQQFSLIPNKSPDELRVLKLIIAADQAYQLQVPSWEEKMPDFIGKASQILEIQTGIKLEIVEFANWQRETKGTESFKALEDELRSDFPRKKFDVVIALTSHYLEGARGVAWSLPGYILINNKGYSAKLDKYGDVELESYPLLSEKKRVATLPSLILHELGHIFYCADHRDKKTCAMHVNESIWATSFCEDCIKTIKKYKWREFPQGDNK